MNDICELCETIKGEHESNYVFVALDPTNNTNVMDAWIYSCSCNYDLINNIKSMPIYNIHDPVWQKEEYCMNNRDTICFHIKKCVAAKILFKSNLNSINDDIIWAKKILGWNWLIDFNYIINDVQPILWSQNIFIRSRHSIGNTKIFTYPYYTVKYMNNSWSCNCTDYKKIKSCPHINKIKLKEELMQNRRELCIGLAKKYIDNHQTTMIYV
jgi:hypothetical protein